MPSPTGLGVATAGLLQLAFLRPAMSSGSIHSPINLHPNLFTPFCPTSTPSRQRERQRDRETGRDTETERQRQKQTDRQRQTQRATGRQ